jgi:hypothetical protein
MSSKGAWIEKNYGLLTFNVFRLLEKDMNRNAEERAISSKGLFTDILIVVLLIASSLPAYSFSIKPIGSTTGDKIITFEVPSTMKWWYPALSKAATDFFTKPIHERATNIIYGCDPSKEECSSIETSTNQYAPTAVLAGNQWNDNPPFKLTGTRSDACAKCVGTTVKAPYYPDCWYLLFHDGEQKAAKGVYFDDRTENVILYRVHFGDMQFLHSMASRDEEEAQVTRANIIMWAEFTYKLAIGQLGRNVVIHQTGIPGMKKLFETHGWTAQQLFIRGDKTFYKESDFRNFVFGSLLHMVQDSYSPSHTERDDPPGGKCSGAPQFDKPGVILSFHSYANQDKGKHKEGDIESALSITLEREPPTMVDVGKSLKWYYENKRPWEEVKPYIECVFEIENPTAKAGPGDRYVRD